MFYFFLLYEVLYDPSDLILVYIADFIFFFQ